MKTPLPDHIWVYTDGSATAYGNRTGSFAAMIQLPDGKSEAVAGACNFTTISRMENNAVVAALY